MNYRNTKNKVCETINCSTGSDTPLTVCGEFDYKKAYTTFFNDTTEVLDAKRIISCFFKKIKNQSVYAHSKEPLNITDIGCSDGQTSLGYLKSLEYKHGFNYYGIDINKPSLNEAQKLLLLDKSIKNLSLINQDAFDEDITKMKEFEGKKFDLIFVSHSAYFIGYTDDFKSIVPHSKFISDISNLLSEKGMAFFIHGNSFFKLRRKYSGVYVRNTPCFLEQATPSHLKHLKVLKFNSKLSFEEIDERLWEEIKHPNNYRIYGENVKFLRTLEKISFIINRSLREMEKEGTLSSFINEIKETVFENHNTFPITSFFQVVVPPSCNFTHQIVKALDETEKDLPDLFA